VGYMPAGMRNKQPSILDAALANQYTRIPHLPRRLGATHHPVIDGQRGKPPTSPHREPPTAQ